MEFKLLAFFSGKINEHGYLFSLKAKPIHSVDNFWQTTQVGTLIINSKTGATFINIDEDVLKGLDKITLDTKVSDCKEMIKHIQKTLNTL